MHQLFMLLGHQDGGPGIGFSVGYHILKAVTVVNAGQFGAVGCDDLGAIDEQALGALASGPVNGIGPDR